MAMSEEIKSNELKQQLDTFADLQRRVIQIMSTAYKSAPELQTIMYQLTLLTIQNKSLTRYLMETGQINGTAFAKTVNEVTDEILKEYVTKTEKPK